MVHHLSPRIVISHYDQEGKMVSDLLEMTGIEDLPYLVHEEIFQGLKIRGIQVIGTEVIVLADCNRLLVYDSETCSRLIAETKLGRTSSEVLLVELIVIKPDNHLLVRQLGYR